MMVRGAAAQTSAAHNHCGRNQPPRLPHPKTLHFVIIHRLLDRSGKKVTGPPRPASVYQARPYCARAARKASGSTMSIRPSNRKRANR